MSVEVKTLNHLGKVNILSISCPDFIHLKLPMSVIYGMIEAAASIIPNLSLFFFFLDLTGFGILESSPPDAQQLGGQISQRMAKAPVSQDLCKRDQQAHCIGENLIYVRLNIMIIIFSMFLTLLMFLGS